MEKENLIDKLIKYFRIENRLLNGDEIPEDLDEKREYLDNIIASRKPEDIDQAILDIESRLLEIELKERGIVPAYEIDNVYHTLGSDDDFANYICLWQGDITRLKVDAIVNAANPSLIGCSIKNHKCVDRLIHSRAGINLKLECDQLIKTQLHEEEVGKAKLTNAYNLPCKYIIHTVGPKVLGNLTDKERTELKNCYTSVLELAKKNELKTIAIPCIATGVYNFPKSEAAYIALSAIKEFLKNNNCFNKVIICTYTNEDYNEYKKLL